MPILGALTSPEMAAGKRRRRKKEFVINAREKGILEDSKAYH